VLLNGIFEKHPVVVSNKGMGSQRFPMQVYSKIDKIKNFLAFTSMIK
jgi:hypothetical protein